MSRFPEELDSDADLPRVVDNVSEVGAEAINALREALFAIQAVLGINPQGSSSSVVSRLDQSLNANGTLRAEAIEASGLVALPVDNDDVATNAAIQEIKLDLDYPTQDLFNSITSNNIDIEEIQNLLTTLSASFTSHTVGVFGRHDGYDIDLTPVLAGTSIDTVGDAIHRLRQDFLDHKSATLTIEHDALAISYTPQAGSAITADTVQEALDEIDEAYLENIGLHIDGAHSNGISGDGYIHFGGQAVVNGASLRATRYVPTGGVELIKLGLVNSATIRSLGFSASGLSATAQNINIRIFTGTTSELVSITGLHSAAYPLAGRTTLRGVVNAINTAFNATQALATAFEDKDEIIIQHNIAADDCLISIEVPGSNSAAAALGFAAVTGILISRVDNYTFNVNTTTRSELATISERAITLALSSTTLNLGVDVGVDGLALQSGQLIHIRDHTGASDGTFTIQTVAASPETTISVNVAVAAGSCNYIIYGDTFKFLTGRRTYDIYVGAEGLPEAVSRAQVTVSQIGGMVLTEVSPTFPASTGTVVVTKSTTTYSIKCVVASVDGIVTNFEQGYTGYIKVWHPNNRDFLMYYVRDSAPSAPVTDTITFTAVSGSDNLLLVGTVFVNSSVVEYPTDFRNIGLIGETSLGTEIYEGVLARDIRNLHSTGVVRGFEVTISSPTTSIAVSGGQAYVSGTYMALPRQIIVATNVATAGTWNVVLIDGTIEIILESGGFALSELIKNSKYCVLAQIVSTGTAITSVTDLRFFVNQVDTRVGLTVDDSDLGTGNVRTLQAAVARTVAMDTSPQITILTDTAISTSFTIEDGARILCLGNLTFSSDLVINDADVTVYGNLIVAGDLTLSDGASLTVHGTCDVTELSIDGSVQLLLGTELNLQSATLTGSNITIGGILAGNTLVSFADVASVGLTVTATSNLNLSNLSLQRAYSTLPIVRIAGTCTDFVFEKVAMSQNQNLTEAEASSVSRVAIHIASAATLDGLELSHCTATNVSYLLHAEGALSNILIDNQSCNIFGGIIYSIGALSNFKVIDGYYAAAAGTLINLPSATAKNGIVVSGNYISDTYSGVPGNMAIFNTENTGVDGLVFQNNILVDLNSNGSLFNATTGSIKGIVDGNTFDNVTADTYVVHTGGTTTVDLLLANNVVVSGTGGFFRGGRAVLSNNFVTMTGVSSELLIDCSLSGSFATGAGFVYLNNNNLVGQSTQDIDLLGVIASNNYFQAGSFTLNAINAPESSGFSLEHNHFKSTNAGAATALSITALNQGSAANKVLCRFDNNVVEGTPTNVLVQIGNSSSSGLLMFSGNLLDFQAPVSGTAILYVGASGSSSTSSQYLIYDNILSTQNIGAVQYGILCNFTSTRIRRNVFMGTLLTLAAIQFQLAVTNAEATDNICTATGAGATIRHASSSPTAVLIEKNRGCEDRIAFSAISAYREGTWLADSSTGYLLTNSSNPATLHFSLDGLPVGARIVALEVHLFAAAGVGTVTCTMHNQLSATAAFTNSIQTTTTNSISGVKQVVTLNPGSTFFVRADQVLSVRVQCTSASNKVGSVVARVVY